MLPNGTLPDGTYEAMVVDAEVVDADADRAPDVVVLCLAITAGPSLGAVVDVQALHLGDDPLSLLAMPCILVVADGEPRVVFD